MPPDENALEQLYQTCAPGLLAFLCARLGNYAWAEDILQDVFVAYMKQDRRDVRSPKGYLFRTAQRLSLNALRDAARADAARRRMATEAVWVPADGGSALACDLADSLSRLPQDQREVLVLRTYGAMTFEEVADTLATPLTTVYMRYREAIERMKRILDADAPRPREVRP